MHGGQSALLGTPPLTESDFYIAKAMVARMMVNSTESDLAKGDVGTLPRPPGYVFESDQDYVMNTSIFMIAYMVLLTLARIAARIFVKRLRTGMDDVMAAVGVVSAGTAFAWDIQLTCLTPGPGRRCRGYTHH